MSDDTSITFLAKEDDSGKAFALLSAVVIVGLVFHAYSFFIVKENDIVGNLLVSIVVSRIVNIPSCDGNGASILRRESSDGASGIAQVFV